MLVKPENYSKMNAENKAKVDEILRQLEAYSKQLANLADNKTEFTQVASELDLACEEIKANADLSAAQKDEVLKELAVHAQALQTLSSAEGLEGEIKRLENEYKELAKS